MPEQQQQQQGDELVTARLATAQHDALFDLGRLAYVPGRVYVCKTWADLAQTYTFLCCSRTSQSEPSTICESHTGGSNNMSKYICPDCPNMEAKPPSIELRRRLECTRNLHGKNTMGLTVSRVEINGAVD